MRPLFQKELRAILPFVLLQLVLTLSGPLDKVFTEYVDMLSVPRSVVYGSISTASEFVVSGFLVSMTLAAGLIVGEKDRGTLELLDALPTTRTQIFFAKVFAGWTVLLVAPVFEVVSQVGLRAVSRTSLDPSFHLDIVFTGAAIHTCQLFTLFGVSLLLSYARRFSWMIAAILIIAYAPLSDMFPALTLLDVVAPFKAIFDGGRWRVPYAAIAVQMSIGLVAYGAAYLLFRGAGDRAMEVLANLDDSKKGRLLLGLATVASVGLWIAVFAAFADSDDDGGEKKKQEIAGAEFSAPQMLRARTDHYTFSYRSNRAARARPMIDEAERIHDEVRRRFAIEPVDLIDVDATHELAEHGFAGLANWKSIRLDLSTVETTTVGVEVLAHETTHVYVAKASDRRFRSAHSWTRFYNEGLAEHVGIDISGHEARRRRHEQLVAVMKARDWLTVDALVNDGFLVNRFDDALAYSFGLVFIDAVIEKWGPEAPFAVVRAMGRPNRPEDLAGLTLWRDTFQAAGYDFDDALSRFFVRAEALAKEHEKLVEAVPRIQASLDVEDGEVVVRPAFDPAPADVNGGTFGWNGFKGRVICRFRPENDATPDTFRVRFGDEDGACRIRRRFFAGEAAHLQIGLYDSPGPALFEPWVEIPL